MFDGAEVIASHRRGYDRDAQIELPAHIRKLEERKRQARQDRGVSNLTKAVPASQLLLTRAAERGADLGVLTNALPRLLDRYGAAELQAAIEGVPAPGAWWGWGSAVSVRIWRNRPDIAASNASPNHYFRDKLRIE
ncbi:hypothetical protein UB46_41015 [Burkholderiaceae bacterium 16]|nr:hypothetical protein UB46_41015 [Burkholderiaceae bacterium 16]